MGFIFGSGKKAAKIQAEATLQSANMQAASDREVARAAVNGMQTQIAQKQASDKAAELLTRPQEAPNVILAAARQKGEVDPVTGRRRSVRSKFFSRSASQVV